MDLNRIRVSVYVLVAIVSAGAGYEYVVEELQNDPNLINGHDR